MCKEEHRPSISEGLSNWQASKDPFMKKVRTALKNNWIKVRTGKFCCGHPGEVGC